MARISQKLFDFAKDTFEGLGFGNPRLLGVFVGASVLSLLALAGFYLPALAELMNGLMSLTVGGGSFLALALLTGGTVGGLIFSIVAGVILAALTTTICSIILFLAPPVAGLLLLPNIVAGASYLLGGVFSLFEACFCCNRNTTEYEPEYTPHHRQGHTQQDDYQSSADLATDSQPGAPGGAFFAHLHRPSNASSNRNTHGREGEPNTNEHVYSNP